MSAHVFEEPGVYVHDEFSSADRKVGIEQRSIPHRACAARSDKTLFAAMFAAVTFLTPIAAKADTASPFAPPGIAREANKAEQAALLPRAAAAKQAKAPTTAVSALTEPAETSPVATETSALVKKFASGFAIERPPELRALATQALRAQQELRRTGFDRESLIEQLARDATSTDPL